MLKEIESFESTTEDNNSSNNECSQKNESVEWSIYEIIEESFKIAMPSWPLQSSVAVNPFWNYRDTPFFNTMISLEQSLGCHLLLNLKGFLERYDNGEILSDILNDTLRVKSLEKTDLDDFIFKARKEQQKDQVNNFTTYINIVCGPDLSELIHADFTKHLMAFIDDRQALISPPNGSNSSFLKYWLQAQIYDRSMHCLGFEGFRSAMKELDGLTNIEVIKKVLISFGFTHSQSSLWYLQTLLGKVLGWVSQFAYQEWQKSLGYHNINYGSKIDVLAVCLAYEYGVYKCQKSSVNILQRSFESAQKSNDKWINQAKLIFQEAWERSIQKELAAKINKSKSKDLKSWCKMIFCIDVRSEMIRRSIEKVIPGVETMGFAGFFGLPVELKLPYHREVTHHLPVLIPSSYRATVDSTSNELELQSPICQSFVKLVRKLSYSSFFYVEIFGLYSAWQLMRDTLSKFAKKLKLSNIVNNDVLQSFPILKKLSEDELETSELVEKCTSILKHMGLTNDFPELVAIVGHTSKTTNNAFQSALNCGACGGHGGGLNAKIAAHLLNDDKIRSGLIKNGIEIPKNTVFIACIHETVTDQIMIMDDQKVPDSHRNKVKILEQQLGLVTKETKAERAVARSRVKSLTNETLRAFNWSEVRPEWGLAGNHSFIVAPRWRTLGQNLSSRSFLHDYNWETDENFSTLELIMTAPMVVTNWINMQYYASVVGHERFGSGSKTLHNIVGEVGVLQGNGGDLMLGLPIESIHDGEKFVHDPLRLSVFIEAPKEAIENIISKHETVQNLVNNKWVSIICIETASGKLLARENEHNYVML